MEAHQVEKGPLTSGQPIDARLIPDGVICLSFCLVLGLWPGLKETLATVEGTNPRRLWDPVFFFFFWGHV